MFAYVMSVLAIFYGWHSIQCGVDLGMTKTEFLAKYPKARDFGDESYFAPVNGSLRVDFENGRIMRFMVLRSRDENMFEAYAALLTLRYGKPLVTDSDPNVFIEPGPQRGRQWSLPQREVHLGASIGAVWLTIEKTKP